MVNTLAMPALNAYNAYMGRRHMQYTIRNVSQGVDGVLRERARQMGRSLNDVALEALAKGAGAEGRPVHYEDLDHFFGSWVEDKALDRAFAAQREVDEKLWK